MGGGGAGGGGGGDCLKWPLREMEKWLHWTQRGKCAVIARTPLGPAAPKGCAEALGRGRFKRQWGTASIPIRLPAHFALL